MTLLGCLSPFVIRLLMARVERAGAVAGQVYGISTVGSLLGTLITVFVLVPALGTRLTFVVLSLALQAIALVGLEKEQPRRAALYLWMPLLVLVLALGGRGRPVKPQEGAIYETESAYNYIQVVERGGCRYLFLNEGMGIQSVYCPGARRVGGTWDFFAIAPFFNPPPFLLPEVRSLAMVGLAGGTIPKLYTSFFGPIPIDGVELDPEIVAAGREFFGMTEPNLRVIVGDGRAFLPGATASIRSWRWMPTGFPTSPGTSRRWSSSSRSAAIWRTEGSWWSTWGGFQGMTVWSQPWPPRWRRSSPPSTRVDVPGSFNTILVATVLPTSPENLRANRMYLTDPALRDIADEALANLRPLPSGGIVLTDDRAPVEAITHALILAYLFGRD